MDELRLINTTEKNSDSNRLRIASSILTEALLEVLGRARINCAALEKRQLAACIG